MMTLHTKMSNGALSEALYCIDSTARPLPEEVDHIICDPPYSERTHDKSDPAVLAGPNSKDWVRSNGKIDTPCDRRALSYQHWSPAGVARAVRAWQPRTRGWFAILTDHLLAPAWADEFSTAGLYVFSPVVCLSPGSRVRLAGDGPSQWSVWLVAARPRHAPYCKWGTLPGGYVYRPEPMPLVGGKPVALMRAIVADYSRPGDLVCDPTCGAGSTLIAAADLGRRWCGIEIDPSTAAMALDRVVGAGQRDGELPLLSMAAKETP